ncbi:hypothetical protein [Tumebacillus flagellatus]|uniref:Asparagine synthase n=1 Tax=Tumebacillus flagellatus TaxID=1157490 RepID=A0A074LQ75_9BACL|nr:hypothetical protein [Tumebacillus flagellatus]KEO82605.1 asparagine synthase [Tumebacillus flagellatus]
MNNVREGLIPTVLGTVVTTTGVALRATKKVDPAIAWGIAGFGLAHVVLGAIDLVEHRNRYDI